MKFSSWLKGYRQEKDIQASGCYVFTENDMLNAFRARKEPQCPTLRDLFAMSFLSGLARGYKSCTGFTKGGNIDKIMALDAALAYGMSDNMMKAREAE